MIGFAVGDPGVAGTPSALLQTAILSDEALLDQLLTRNPTLAEAAMSETTDALAALFSDARARDAAARPADAAAAVGAPCAAAGCSPTLAVGGGELELDCSKGGADEAGRCTVHDRLDISGGAAVYLHRLRFANGRLFRYRAG